MKERLKKALATRYPTLKSYQIERCVDKYVAEVIAELGCQLALGNIENGEIDFPSDAVRARCNRIKVDGAQRYVLSVMNEHPSTSLIHVAYEGNNITHEVSKVIFNPRYKRDVLNALQKESVIQQLNPAHLDELEAKANRDIDVDVKSLESYIKATRSTLAQGGHHDSYEESLTASMLIAKALLTRVRTIAGKTILREYWEEADCGRVYGHGLSLQRVPRQVRNAALGHCHKYDFKASSYALMTSFALQIDPKLKVGAIKDYIKHRSVIRKRIATKIGVSEAWMKEIFTAIGFGAKTNDNPFSYVRNKLGSEKYSALMTNDEFVYIKLQFDAVTETIAKECPNDGFEFFGRTYSSVDPKRGLKRTRAQKLAWVYQCMESAALQEFVALTKQAPLLSAHDCLFFKNRLALSLESDVRYQLNQQFSELNFEHQEVQPISFDDPSIDAATATHRKRIEEAEWDARHYTSPTMASFDARTVEAGKA